MTAETGSAIGAKGLLGAAGVGLAVVAVVLWLVFQPREETVTEAPTQVAIADAPEAAITDLTDPASPDITEPGFDVVRVDPEGNAVVAGHAEPGSTIQLTLDGEAIENVDVDSDGNFVALLDLPVEEPSALGMAAVADDGNVIENSESVQTVLIAPSAAPAVAPKPTQDAQTAEVPVENADVVAAAESEVTTQSAPQVLLADDQGITVLQDSTGQPAVENVVIDAISYDETGEVALTGRGQGGSSVRVYLNNAPLQTATISEGGQWRLPLPEVDSGVYTLRVDELSPDGTVTSRTETPFKREDAAQLAAASAGDQSTSARVEAVTVQPGSTLWAIAREHLGGGVLYVRVFEANRDQIRNPDLIYPGQVFAIPEAQ